MLPIVWLWKLANCGFYEIVKLKGILLLRSKLRKMSSLLPFKDTDAGVFSVYDKDLAWLTDVHKRRRMESSFSPAQPGESKQKPALLVEDQNLVFVLINNVDQAFSVNSKAWGEIEFAFAGAPFPKS